MHEFRIKSSEFLDAVIKNNDGPFLSREIIEKLIKEYNESVVGHGIECIVMNDSDSGFVKAFDYKAKNKNPEYIKKIFYNQRILSELFPNNFPRFVAAFADGRKGYEPGTIRRKIDSTSTSSSTLKSKVEDFKNLVFPNLKEIGINIVDFDDGAPNFLMDSKGYVWYTDRIPQLKFDERYSEKDWKSGVILKLQALRIPDQSIRIIISSIERLLHIDQIKSTL